MIRIISGKALPAKLPKGAHLLEAVTRDMYGREYTAKRILRVE